MKIEYNSEKTILKCKRREIEWYNDQPGDKCSKNCDGELIRILK